MATDNVMFKTKFWTDTKIMEDFTPEDRYFYLWCITNPHTNIIGCFEVGKKIIALELGYNADENRMVNALIKRFEKDKKMIMYDTTTNEILVLNALKHNYNTSPTVKLMIKKALGRVKSTKLINTILDQLDQMGIEINDDIANKLVQEIAQKRHKLTGCQHPVRGVCNTPISISIEECNDKSDIVPLITEQEIKDMFLVLWKSYPVKKGNVQALKTLTNKLSGLTLEQAKEKGNKIYLLMKERLDDDWAECDPKYIPHFSSWLNQEVPDQKKASGATHKRGNK